MNTEKKKTNKGTLQRDGKSSAATAALTVEDKPADAVSGIQFNTAKDVTVKRIIQ